ncbi:MAG: response regulator [Acidobacteriota bacterium]|jgi:PAS domain S-box-containing protein|nr:response regulator [Acidobacteriota bacterium]
MREHLPATADDIGICVSAAAEAELLDSNQRLQAMLDIMPFACCFWDATGAPIDCNNRALEIFQCRSKQEFLRHFYDFAPEYQPDGHPSDEKARSLIKDAYKSADSRCFTWEHRTAAGKPLATEVTLMRVDWQDGYRVVGYIRDLSKLREAQDDMIRMNSIVEHSPRLAIFMGPFGKVEYVNHAAAAICGCKPQDLVKSGLRLLFEQESLRRLMMEYLPELEDRRQISAEMAVTDKDGVRRTLSISVFAIELPGGRPGVGITGQDITDMLRIQRELEVAKVQAEHGLAEERRYNQAKSDFISRMSHEMRTPLNVITGMARIAAATDDEERRRDAFAKQEEASRRLLSIIDRILELGKLDNGTLALIEQETSLPDLLADLGRTAETAAAARRLTFEADIDDGLPERIVADGDRLKEVVWNLLDNAVKYTPAGGRVRLAVAKAEGGRPEACLLRFAVGDSGPGISDELKGRIWSSFEQKDNGIAREHGGVGLGLPLAKRLAVMMGGDIALESSPGAGSTFTCHLQVRLPDAPPVDKGLDDGAPPSLAGCRILIVDDVEINREILLSMLEESGAILDCAADGFEAVARCGDRDYDLVLMDLHMPGMDGFEATSRIRASGAPRTGRIPVVAVTADIGDDVEARCNKVGMNACICKPVDYDGLYATIQRCLSCQGSLVA